MKKSEKDIMIESIFMVLISIGLGTMLAFFSGAFVAGLLIVIGITSEIAIGIGIATTIILWTIMTPEIAGRFSEID